ncbi:protein SHQ1 homolog [Panonychus citri]|uniref:protein SHQ1 homolog n=1 Tax=Panonychus citri TaxID=50023 RepID=UPI002306EDB9|nr:protein SHQ1 homolog [Panonychus citri]
MITPNFKINQDPRYIHLLIKAPMAKIGETSVAFDDEMFCFHSKPYYLRLHLPGKLATQDGSEKIDWDGEKNEFVISLLKATEGEHFNDLNMLTKLLTKPNHQKNIKLNSGIEVLDQEVTEDQEDYDWYIDQSEWTEDEQKSLMGEKYGFANRYSGILSRFLDEIGDLLELKQPETTDNCERKELRLQKDKEMFDEDHYWFDLYEQKDTIKDLISFKLDWEKTTDCDSCNFNDEQIFRMKNLPKREYLLSKKEKFQLLLGLIDILFAYSYDMRTTEGEHTCESGWTIIKLSATLSWLQIHSTLPETLVTCVQRSLVHPLYRNWNLSLKVINDVYQILTKGRSFIIKCLLDVHRILNESGDLQYIFNDLYITDYCVWIQNVREETFRSLAEAMKKIEITKEMIGFDLQIIEKAAELAFNESIQ